MKVAFDDMPVYDVPGVPAIFLAGPTARSNDYEKSWRKDAVEYLESKGFQGIVFVPEHSRPSHFDDTEAAWDARTEWEWKCIEAADCVVFWVPRRMPDMPGLTTNLEFGMCIGDVDIKHRVILGYPEDADAMQWMDKKYRLGTGRCASHSLEETLDCALVHVDPHSNSCGLCLCTDVVGRHVEDPSMIDTDYTDCYNGSDVPISMRVTPKEGFYVDEAVVRRTPVSIVQGWHEAIKGNILWGRYDNHAKLIATALFLDHLRECTTGLNLDRQQVHAYHDVVETIICRHLDLIRDVVVEGLRDVGKYVSPKQHNAIRTMVDELWMKFVDGKDYYGTTIRVLLELWDRCVCCSSCNGELKVCHTCLKAIESREGPLNVRNYDGEDRCDWCKDATATYAVSAKN